MGGLVASAASRPARLVPAAVRALRRHASKPAFYRARHLPTITPDNCAPYLDAIARHSKEILAPNPSGLLVQEYINKLVQRNRMRLSYDAKQFRGVIDQIPHVAYAQRQRWGFAHKVLVYPAYRRNMVMRPRTLSDYDAESQVGQAALRQLRDITSTFLGLFPRGLLLSNYCKRLRPYGHNIDDALARELLARISDVAILDPAPIYSEFDVIRKPRTGNAPERTRRKPGELMNKKRGEKRSATLERFLKWYDDPFPSE